MSRDIKDEIAAAVETLKSGGIILYPTDTVWGIGCDATNRGAIEKIEALKERVDKKSMIIITDSIDRAACYTRNAPDIAWELMETAVKPLTLILPRGTAVAQNLLPEEGTIAIRVADHQFCKMLCRKFGRAIVSTSANISSEPTPKGFKDISERIIGGVDMVVDPAFEGKPTGKPSSIIALSPSAEIKIIRE